MSPLSSDPAKRRRQLDYLQRGGGRPAQRRNGWLCSMEHTPSSLKVA